MSKNIRVVIADDHPIFRKGLIQVVETDAALDVIGEAEDGAAAERLIRELQPDVVVLDINMPIRNGLEVALAIQQSKLPVQTIFITAYKDEDMFNEAMNRGVRGYVLKESAVHDILAGIKAVANGERFISPALSDFLFQRAERSKKLKSQKPGLGSLTPTEQRILRMISTDRTSKEIADELGISYRTVENHRANTAAKLGLHGSHSLLKFAFDHKTELQA